jgi:hypothetical protein
VVRYSVAVQFLIRLRSAVSGIVATSASQGPNLAAGTPPDRRPWRSGKTARPDRPGTRLGIFGDLIAPARAKVAGRRRSGANKLGRRLRSGEMSHMLRRFYVIIGPRWTFEIRRRCFIELRRGLLADGGGTG